MERIRGKGTKQMGVSAISTRWGRGEREGKNQMPGGNFH